MGIFHRNLDNEINSLINILNKSSVQIPNNWHWLDYKTKKELLNLEEIDLNIMKKLNQLHKQGRDIPLLNSKILQLCTELLEHIEAIKKLKRNNQLSDETKIIYSITSEINQIFSRELSLMHHESKKLVYENKLIHKIKKKIIDRLSNHDVKWDTIKSNIRELFCTRTIWDGFINGEKDMFNLITNGGKYEEHYKIFKHTLNKIQSAKPEGMVITPDGSAWFHIETTPNNRDKFSFLGFSLKRYVTIDPSSIWDMLKYLLKLAIDIQQIGIRNNDKINIKIPGSFLSFIKHSDSIVIHYNNHESKKDIEKTLQDWLKRYNIKTLKRDYDRAEHARDFIGTSFSDNVAETVLNLMKNNYGKMSNEALVIAGINYGFKISAKNYQ